MIFIEINEAYLEAARLIVECKPKKLPLLLSALEQAGIHIADESLEFAKVGIIKGRTSWLKDKRKNHADWEDSSDEVILVLRDAYYNGVNFSDIAGIAGIGRTTLYTVLKTGRFSNDSIREKLKLALSEK